MNNALRYLLLPLTAAALLLTWTAGCKGRTDRTEIAETDTLQPEPSRVSLLFAGDVMCHMPQITAARRGDGYDFTPSFEYVKPVIAAADVAIVNFETVVSPDGRYAGYPCFSSPAALAGALKDAGVDIALTANNHCCDRGRRGIAATAHCLDTLGIACTGTFCDSTDYEQRNPLRFESRGVKFALINYTYGTNGLPVPEGCIVNLTDTAAMARDLEAARDADFRIAYMHWGEEYARRPTASQRSLAAFLHRHGADLVIGSHPHVIQPADTCAAAPTLYSLGNFVSNQRKRYCDGGLMVQAEVEKSAEGEVSCSLRFIPVWVRLPGYRILPPAVADTLAMSADERWQYEQFRADTKSLLQLQ